MKNEKTAGLIKSLFKDNWNDVFIFDAKSDKKIKYSELFGRALFLRDYLKNRNFKKNDLVCVIMQNSLDLAVVYFGGFLAEICIAPVDPQKSRAEIEEILSQISPVLIIHDFSDSDLIENPNILNVLAAQSYKNKKPYEKPYDVIHISELEKNIPKELDIKSYTEADLDIFDELDYDSLFIITFTSGSTGLPKGVMTSFNNFVLTSLAFNKRFNFGNENIFYHNLPMTYMAGILNLIFLPFLCGSKVIIGERFSVSAVANFWEFPVKYSANVFWFIPTELALLLRLDRGTKGTEYASKTKIIGCVGTAPLSPGLKREFEEHYKIYLYESYGLSETLLVATNSPFLGFKEGSVGPPLDGANISIAEDGEILINVPWMFLGYSNVDTVPYFRGNKYLSGDIGLIEESDSKTKGFVTITDRKKDLIIRGGINISPKKIEDYINTAGLFNEVVVLGVPDPILGEKIVCFYVLKAEKEMEKSENNAVKADEADEGVLLEKEINKRIVDALGRNYSIDVFSRIDAVPRNINGKIDKPALKRLFNK